MLIFRGAGVIFPDRIRDKQIIVEKGKIIDICDRFDAEGAEVVDCRGLYLSPGFIDLHVHGGGGYSAMSGRVDDVLRMCAAHAPGFAT